VVVSAWLLSVRASQTRLLPALAVLALERILLTVFLGKEKSMLSENQRRLFAEFHKSIEAEGIFDEKPSHLIKVAAAMAFGCYP